MIAVEVRIREDPSFSSDRDGGEGDARGAGEALSARHVEGHP